MPQCFFVPRQSGSRVIFSEDKAHHISTVLRLKVGEEVRVHDGAGNAATAVLAFVDRKKANAELISPWERVNTEPGTRITIFQSLPKTGDKVEQVLQHGTELGAAGFVLFASERAQARFEDRDRIEKKVGRWEELVRNAAEQSGRGILPSVTYFRNLTDALARTIGQTRILLENAGTPLREATLPDAPLAVFVGPESGFSDAEKQEIAGIALTLGPRMLRTETAALAGLAQILLYKGD